MDLRQYKNKTVHIPFFLCPSGFRLLLGSMTLKTEIASGRLQTSSWIIEPKMITKGKVRKIQSPISRWVNGKNAEKQGARCLDSSPCVNMSWLWDLPQATLLLCVSVSVSPKWKGWSIRFCTFLTQIFSESVECVCALACMRACVHVCSLLL